MRCAKTREGGGASRDRTGDLLHAMQALSQLSYGPKKPQRIFAHPKKEMQALKNGTPDGDRTRRDPG